MPKGTCPKWLLLRSRPTSKYISGVSRPISSDLQSRPKSSQEKIAEKSFTFWKTYRSLRWVQGIFLKYEQLESSPIHSWTNLYHTHIQCTVYTVYTVRIICMVLPVRVVGRTIPYYGSPIFNDNAKRPEGLRHSPSRRWCRRNHLPPSPSMPPCQVAKVRGRWPRTQDLGKKKKQPNKLSSFKREYGNPSYGNNYSLIQYRGGP